MTQVIDMSYTLRHICSIGAWCVAQSKFKTSKHQFIKSDIYINIFQKNNTYKYYVQTQINGTWLTNSTIIYYENQNREEGGKENNVT